MSLDSSVETQRQAITTAVLDYYGGWFEGDDARMERALHPELCKRSLQTDGTGDQTLETLTAQQMIKWTADGLGKKRLAQVGDPDIEVDVQDVYDGIANVTVRSAVYREYIQLARTREGWKVVNVLWQWTQGEPEPT